MTGIICAKWHNSEDLYSCSAGRAGTVVIAAGSPCCTARRTCRSLHAHALHARANEAAGDSSTTATSRGSSSSKAAQRQPQEESNWKRLDQDGGGTVLENVISVAGQDHTAALPAHGSTVDGAPHDGAPHDGACGMDDSCSGTAASRDASSGTMSGDSGSSSSSNRTRASSPDTEVLMQAMALGATSDSTHRTPAQILQELDTVLSAANHPPIPPPPFSDLDVAAGASKGAHVPADLSVASSSSQSSSSVVQSLGSGKTLETGFVAVRMAHPSHWFTSREEHWALLKVRLACCSSAVW